MELLFLKKEKQTNGKRDPKKALLLVQETNVLFKIQSTGIWKSFISITLFLLSKVLNFSELKLNKQFFPGHVT